MVVAVAQYHEIEKWRGRGDAEMKLTEIDGRYERKMTR
jgi:hypothetical protein